MQRVSPSSSWCISWHWICEYSMLRASSLLSMPAWQSIKARRSQWPFGDPTVASLAPCPFLLVRLTTELCRNATSLASKTTQL
ncbi:hypothetical protein P389DRAFT_26426 [Cystobasidium minutum MCA 4210]|uniref:uncharacterized protein n=1 Tax=Cystobasidium minutum MCA 4210 TaxID=1397322 RepID=UPI0034CFB41C|eukprot:jgi/Rhomi1/26426/CE26425_131